MLYGKAQVQDLIQLHPVVSQWRVLGFKLIYSKYFSYWAWTTLTTLPGNKVLFS